MKNVEDVYKLSPRQRDLLPGAGRGSAVEHLTAHLTAPLDTETLAHAASELFSRHTALRTAFFSEKLKEPMQVVRDKVEPALFHHALPDPPKADRSALLDSLLAEDRRHSMNPASAPLTRIAVARGALVLAFHPLALDMTSAEIALRELLALVQATRSGASAGLERPRPFRDYIAWLEERNGTADADYFCERLTGVAPARLPEEGDPGPNDSADAAPIMQQIILSPATTANLQTVLRRGRLSLATLIHAAWALLLRGRGAGSDLVFGALVSGRPAALPRSQAMIGRFAGIVPRRILVPESGGLRRFLNRLDADLGEARNHEHASLGQIRGWLRVDQHTPLFHHVVAVDELGQDQALKRLAHAVGLRSARGITSNLSAPLTITAVPGARLTLRLTYDPRRLPAGAVLQLADDLGAIVESMAADPDQDLGRLSALAAPKSPRATVTAARVGVGPAEIEALLAKHPLVRSAAVAPDDTTPDGLVARVHINPAARPGGGAKLDFSLFYFADADADGANKYRIYLEGAKFADEHGFTAVWTPERHFHPNGGLYPNPSVLSAALATITRRVALRAGSVVLPLHHPLRVAEEWSVVDNLSGGRVGISIASGWVPNDFAFAPEAYPRRRERMFEVLAELQRLWRGETISVKDGAGKATELGVYPRPVQATLPIWLTAAGNPDTFEKAGELGLNVLTSLLSHPLEDAEQKIALYRAARARAGHDPATGTVTMMLHAFVGPDADEVLQTVQAPLTAYLRSHVALVETMVKSLDMQVDINDPRLLDDMASFAFERYQRTGALIGTPTSCLAMLDRLHAADVDEVACLIDFGVGVEDTLSGLLYLDELRRLQEDDALLVKLVLSEHLDERLSSSRPRIRFELLDGNARRGDV